MSTQNALAEITDVFTANIQELRIFNERIGRLAEEYDRTTLDDFLQTLTNILGIDLSVEPASTIPSGTEEQKAVRTYGDLAEGTSHKGKEHIAKSTASPTDLEVQRFEERFRLMFEDSETARKFFMAAKQLMKGSPRQGLLLRRGALVALVSYLEALLSELIQSFYLRYPAALPAESRLLSLNDLREIGSVEEAERSLIIKEVDSVLREGFEQQLRYFSDRLKVNLKPLAPYIPNLIEISQRRNLIVHNKGIINRLYLRNVSEDVIKKSKIKEGDELTISEEYLSNAIDNIYLCGVILSQQCWRKWDKTKENAADNTLNNHIYEALSEGRFELVIRLALFTDSIKFFTENDRRIATINHAIALRELGDQEQMEAVLSKHDWSACAIRFTLALHAVRAEEEAFFNTLQRAIAAGEIYRHALEEWPLFIPFRGMPRFQAVIEECPLQPFDAKELSSGGASVEAKDLPEDRELPAS